MELKLNIPEEEFNEFVGDMIKGRVKHVLRNDDVIQEMIRELVVTEVNKKINSIVAERTRHITPEYIQRVFTNQVGLLIQDQTQKEVHVIINKLLSNVDTSLLEDLLKQKAQLIK